MDLTTAGYLGIWDNTTYGAYTPTHLIDVWNGDINVTSTSGTNGFMISGNPVLNNGGDVTCIFVGQQASATSYSFNHLTCVGSGAGTDLTAGIYDSYLGFSAGGLDADGSFNTFIGAFAGASTNGGGWPAGSYNTFTGYECGLENISGKSNCFYGKAAGYYNDGAYNCMYGGHSGNGTVLYGADSNCFYGEYSANKIHYGNDNIVMGFGSGENTGELAPSDWNVFIGGNGRVLGQSNPSGIYNVTLGFGADAYTSSSATPGTINNSVAIGADAIVSHDNQFILGNNSQFLGIGMVGDSYGLGPMANLEIMTDQNTVPPYGSFGFIGNGYYNSLNFYAGTSASPGTGFSGLKFRDLTSNSNPVDPTSANFNPSEGNPYPAGVLSIDGFGNVIYIPAPAASLGTCGSPTLLPAGGTGAIDLNGGNFYFSGNGTGAAGVDNVAIGLNCSVTPNAKLEVIQASGDNNTIGTYITNSDGNTGAFGTPTPTIGMVAFMPQPSNTTNTFYNVAGWFQADGGPNIDISSSLMQYAIFVPSTINPVDGTTLPGGTVDIGYQFALDVPDYLLDVNDYARIDGTVVPSDSNLKKSITPFKYGLKAIRNLSPINYKYNGIGGFDSTKSFIGLIAQNLQRNVPSGVKKSHIIKDTINRDTATILNIYEEAVMYTAVNAIKELDSTVTSKNKTIDSLRTTLDSLRSAFKGFQDCLNRLCNTHGHIGGGNSGNDNNNENTSNIQDVALSNANAPLLYQNIPNPFSSNTKINYYLPVGTIGATIVFYDSYGNQMKEVQLSQTGNGTLNINPENLSNGIYSYSLVVNGKVVDTKRMILQK